MQYDQSQGMIWLYSPHWKEQGVTAAFSTRVGGQSQEPYSSLNLGLHVGDEESIVISNRENWLKALGLRESAQPCCAEQVHGCRVAVVTGEDAGKGYRKYGESLPQTDAMITNVKNLPLMTFYADCIPVFFFDPVQRVIGLAHSGWKGTADRISAHTVEALINNYDCSASDIEVIIGPGIGRCCYEVDERVAAVFRKEFADHQQLLYPKNQDQHWQLDLKSTVKLTLIQAGVHPEKIEDVGICTSCRRDLYYSHRGEGGRCGRMGALIELG